MRIKSLLKDEIEVAVNLRYGLPSTYFWGIENACDFGIKEIEQHGESRTEKAAKLDFAKTAKRHGWENWRFV